MAAAAGTKGLKSETSSAWPIPRAGRKKRATNSFLEAHFPSDMLREIVNLEKKFISS